MVLGATSRLLCCVQTTHGTQQMQMVLHIEYQNQKTEAQQFSPTILNT
jgi:hypothetical protein